MGSLSGRMTYQKAGAVTIPDLDRFGAPQTCSSASTVPSPSLKLPVWPI
jgi:hypothetical protein